ncbi:MAG TPA: ankyrin repeat domain-containing protein, partial [Candidatus Acidoferrum sp.]|nr:ankyrin repeat domain-containing protein [Candidatus Acidoferrum sp.]
PVNSGGFAGTPLTLAAYNGFRGVAEVLLTNKADVNQESRSGNTPLSAAISKGYKAMVELLLQHGAEVNREQGVTSPLHTASFNGEREIMVLLLSHKANVNSVDSQGRTPLIVAAEVGSLTAAQVLLDHKADPNAAEKLRLTALHWAACKGNKEMTDLLLARGADPGMKAANVGTGTSSERTQCFGAGGMTPLHVAVTRDAASVVQSLLQHKADVNVRNASGSTPLLLADDLEVMKLLIASGADVNAAPDGGNATALYLAVYRKGAEAVELLLTNGANPNFSGPQGSPLQLVDLLFNNDRDLAKKRAIRALLEKHGANEHFDRLGGLRAWSAGRPGKTEEGRTGMFFRRATNDWNRYTLFELLASSFSIFQFPDWTNARISSVKGKELVTTRVDLASMFNGPCTNDFFLEWGDMLEVPVLDHKLGETSPELPESVRAWLRNCLAREVRLVVKQETNVFRLIPYVPQPSVRVNPLRPTRNEQPADTQATAAIKTLASFRLNVVVLAANVLRASSDVTRVRVRRPASTAAPAQEWVIDLTNIVPDSVQNGPVPGGKLAVDFDLWLRDGDVIDIPEKQ